MKYYIVSGTNWTTNDTGSSNDFTEVSYGNNIHIISGYYASALSYSILTSTNGSNWTTSVTGEFIDHPVDIEYSNNFFITIGLTGIRTSTDGTT